MNSRRSARELRDPDRWRDLLRRLEQAVADTRSMARTLGYHSASQDQWDPGFRDRWPRLLGDAGRAVAADPRAIRSARERLTTLVVDVGDLDPKPGLWPVYGALTINLRNILDAMDEVAAANPLDQPPLPMARMRERGRSARRRQG
ncbi:MULTISPECIES: hypothetical protein [unclassified Nocardioides]|uniref:hypothetical protein n=1 Tax=unclassified Nocardioides TaxID=2615069 RepID=UPI0009EFAB0D|nr:MULTISPECIES: hypothetical protein [unclassified Nocardioides]GAW49360.1 uncharacterized protein PD653B2_1682 [Nocardioides sp. PD653-B2]GAW55126.1 uncharacterized protein PD653_2545 [Nocardioides sp. PD653]